MTATETFANNTIATVVSGGTDAPVSGTVETWTLAGGYTLPAAVTSAYQFHAADVALPSEKFLVTNLSGTTATVTRGAEGTTPVAHASGFTIRQVITAGVAGGLAPLSPTAATLPAGWNTQWLAAKAAAAAGTGTAKIGTIGDSYTVGVSSGTVTDVLTYGWLGRLDALLLNSGLAAYAEGYQIAGLAPGGAITNSPSSPYGNSSLPGTTTAYDGGCGFCYGTNLNGSTWVTISCPLHPVTGAAPTGIDIFTIDFNSTATWQYSVDGGSATTITPPSGTPPTGVNGTTGQGIVRRTSITLSGGISHNVALQQNQANGLFLMGHVTYYGSAGLGLMRNGLSGTRAVDYATQGGTTASSTGGVSLTPDHIIPWAGLGPSSTPANNYMYASAASGFPFSTGAGCDLGIIMLGGNEMFTGTGLAATEKTVSRMINAFRRGVPATSTTPGASVLIVMQPIVSNYSSNYQAWSGQYFQQIKRIYAGLAAAYGCGFIDLQEVFGEDPLSRGLFSADGQQHPTQNGSGAGGGDGHLLIAQTIYGVL